MSKRTHETDAKQHRRTIIFSQVAAKLIQLIARGATSIPRSPQNTHDAMESWNPCDHKCDLNKVPNLPSSYRIPSIQRGPSLQTPITRHRPSGPRPRPPLGPRYPLPPWRSERTASTSVAPRFPYAGRCRRRSSPLAVPPGSLV